MKKDKMIYDSSVDCECSINDHCDCNEITLVDKCDLLDKELDGTIVAIIDLGFWNGRAAGSLKMSNNLNTILQNISGSNDIYVYSDGTNIRCKATHHDGTHYILFREVTDDDAFNELWDSIENGMSIEALTERAMQCTRSIEPYIKEIYGVDYE